MSLNLSIVIPAKDEESSIAELCGRIACVLAAAQLSYEIIFIDDGSEDNTWEEIKKA
ncbi:MAG: glycosyltransferase, partial [Candidatus Nephrothrix sp. EaCA]